MIAKLREWWRAESARLASIVLALVAAGLIPGVWGKVLGAVLPILAGQAVRQTVYAPDTVREKVEMAATAVVGQLDGALVGPLGSVPPAAQAVIDGVVEGTLAA